MLKESILDDLVVAANMSVNPALCESLLHV